MTNGNQAVHQRLHTKAAVPSQVADIDGLRRGPAVRVLIRWQLRGGGRGASAMHHSFGHFGGLREGADQLPSVGHCPLPSFRRDPVTPTVPRNRTGQHLTLTPAAKHEPAKPAWTVSWISNPTPNSGPSRRCQPHLLMTSQQVGITRSRFFDTTKPRHHPTTCHVCSCAD